MSASAGGSIVDGCVHVRQHARRTAVHRVARRAAVDCDGRIASEHAFRQDLVERQVQSFALELLDRP
eukprot:2880580-Alexandrium_andersonii.AAC.1